ncbi:MAG: aquaporin family protein [Rhizobiales bacterium]|nr:aquaporin family protein [Hyphomicrobiales bacterium]
MTPSLSRRLTAEALGTLLLVATVVGSGIMAEKLAGGNVAIALLGNTLPTGAILVVLITLLGPVSGAHFNPVVTGIFAADGSLKRSDALPYMLAQIAGGIAGTLLAHAMFGLPLLGAGVATRTGMGQWIGEFTATFTLLLVIIGGLRHAPQSIPLMVGLTITAAYWFTSSTSFANPAVTIARAFTPTFAGIAPGDVMAFITAQIAGGIAGAACGRWLFGSTKQA